MFKRTLLVIGLMAAVFSAQADLMTYTFQGKYTLEDVNSVVSVVNINFTYDILVDFDEPGLDGGVILNDRYDPIIQFGTQVGYMDRNYGSADFSSDDLYYSNDAVDYNTAYAFEYESSYYGTITNANSISFSGVNGNLITNQLSFSNSTSFEVGNQFNVTEIYNDYENDKFYELTGFSQLISVEAVEPPQNVPEPGSVTLLFSSIIALSGFGFRRKK